MRLPARLLRPRVAAGLFAATITVVFGGLTWVTATALAVESAERTARAESEQASRTRLALWRLDGQLFPAIAVENGRPFADYGPAPTSPLRTTEFPDWMAMHFQLDAEGGWSSPQLPPDGDDAKAAARRGHLERLRADCPAADTLAVFDAAAPQSPPESRPPPAQAAIGADLVQNPNGDEFANRKRLALQNSMSYAQQATVAPPPPEAMVRATPVAVQVGPLRATWLPGDQLVLVRTARLAEATVYQGVLFDWPALQRHLTKEVADLFPAAAFQPLRTPQPTAPELAMTALPVQLVPGGPPPPPGPAVTPLRLALGIVWLVVAVAVVAVGLGGQALLDLSERRIRFVAAVTHELRTPLTTLRLYLDLLNSGLITDAAKRGEYLATLGTEADRLHRLVENVLDFARLESRSASARLQPVTVAHIVAAVEAEWAGRCRESGKTLVAHSVFGHDARVPADAGILTQLLGILIDNARKYSREAADDRIWLTAGPAAGGRVEFVVEDRGPGVPAAERAVIFEPFRRGAAADVTAGGAGLGLALARHWATQLRGRLTVHDGTAGGTRFILVLDAAG